jgi:hypothetical protein
MAFAAIAVRHPCAVQRDIDVRFRRISHGSKLLRRRCPFASESPCCIRPLWASSCGIGLILTSTGQTGYSRRKKGRKGRRLLGVACFTAHGRLTALMLLLRRNWEWKTQRTSGPAADGRLGPICRRQRRCSIESPPKVPAPRSHFQGMPYPCGSPLVHYVCTTYLSANGGAWRPGAGSGTSPFKKI